MRPKVPLKSPIWILFLLCAIFEIFGLLIVGCTQRSICIAAYEVSQGAMVFILLLFTAVFPDIVYVICIVFMKDLGKEPVGIMYNLIIGLCCLVGSLVLLIMLTLCGNPTQIWLLIAGILGLLAGLAHIINFGIAHWKLPSGEKYLIPRVKKRGSQRKRSVESE